MAKVITTELQHSGAASANITLDSSKNVTAENNLQVDGALTVTGAINGSGASLTNLPASPPAFRNLIINGAMNINQRGTYTGQGTSGKYSADRWDMKGQASGMEHAFVHQDTGMAEFPKCIRMDCTTAATGAVTEVKIVQPIESQNLVHLLWGTSSAKSITVSFWCRSNQTGTYVFWIYKDDGSRHNAKTYTISAADTWEKKTITFAGDQTTAIANDNTRGLSMSWILNTGTGYSSGSSPNGTWESLTDVNRYAGQTATIGGNTNDYFDLTGVQIEEGTTATDFEHRSYADELARCQRYYHLIASGAWGTGMASGTTVMHSSTDARVCIDFPVQMRTAPSVVQTADSSGTWKFYTGSSNGTATDCDTIESTQNFAMLAFYSVSGSMSAGAAGWFASNKSVARLAVNSEL